MLRRMTAVGATTRLLERSEREGQLELSMALIRRLAAAYAEPPRAYHHLGHVLEVLACFDWAGSRVAWRQPGEVTTAILFHDAVYVAGARDNEARSAELAGQALGEHAELAGLDRARVVELIELTARHGKLAPGDVDDEAARFLDCDLAIVAAPAARYRRYAAEIAEEYRAVPAEAYRAGRAAFVAGLLARPRIFLSELFHRELDGAARGNLQAELETLAAAATRMG
jgi:predicted metal-dependent HD superfamily phosphohydrolase